MNAVRLASSHWPVRVLLIGTLIAVAAAFFLGATWAVRLVERFTG